VPARHQTLRDTIAWSYDLLSPDEQVLFRRLAIFVGGCTLDAAVAVGTADVGDRRWSLTPDEVLDGVESLIAKNLVRRLEGATGSRFSPLETIREYGLEQLEQQSELLSLRRWHVLYFLALAERAEPALRGHEQAAWMDRLEAEHDNMRAALEWSLADASAVEATLRLASSLAWFWTGRTHLGEGRRWLERSLARDGGSAAARLKALNGVAWIAHFQRDRPAAEQFLGEALALARELGDTWATAWALQTLGRTAYYAGDAVRARALGEESLALARDLGDDWLTGWIFQLLGLAAYIAGDLATARAHFESSVAIRRPIGAQEGLGVCLQVLGIIASADGDDLRALQLSREGLIAVQQVFRIAVHNGMSNFVALAARFGQLRQAIRLAGASDRIGRIISMTMIPLNQRLYDEALAEVRRQLDDAAFAEAWAEGQALSLDEAVAEALAVEAPSGETPGAGRVDATGRTDRRSSLDLTEREAAVLRLIVAGKTTREIALALSVSPNTVERHITHLYGKIGARGRADATVYALEHGLTPSPEHGDGGNPPSSIRRDRG
jgi:non-specific serine/threonine protein kinase